MTKHSVWELQSMQAAPLSVKVALTKDRIREWVKTYGEDGVYVSFSGGKDSTVLLHIVREMYPNVRAVFCDTGLEYPEIREFVKKFDNVEWLKPKLTFRQVIEKYGYPMISKEVSECVAGARRYLRNVEKNMDVDQPWEGKYERITGTGDYSTGKDERSLADVLKRDLGHMARGAGSPLRAARLMGLLTQDGKISAEIKPGTRSKFSMKKYEFFLQAPFEISHYCCQVMKKSPAHLYAKHTGRKAMTAMMASESRIRTQKWLQNGCNGFSLKHPTSNPMAFWTEQDVLHYIYKNKIEIAPVYGEVVVDGYVATGDDDGQLSLADFGLFDKGAPIFSTTGCHRTGCVFCGFGCNMEKPGDGRFEKLKQSHPKLYDYVMRPWSEGGLGYREVIEWINEHGNMDIRF